MIEFLYHRIVNNKWLFICLIFGVIFACGIFASVPMYSNAILQKVLTKDLENYHARNSVSPGTFTVTLGEYASSDSKIAAMVENVVQRELCSAYKLPLVEKVRQVNCSSVRIIREGDESLNERHIYALMTSINDYGENIKILRGKTPGNSPENGIYEAAVSLEAFERMQLLLDNVYSISGINHRDDDPPELIKVKITCVFTVQDKNELFWSGGRYDNLKNSLIFDSGALEKLATDIEEIKIQSIDNTFFLDYHTIKIADVNRIRDTYSGQQRWNAKNGNPTKIKLPVVEVLKSYEQREKELGITLWILTIPLMIIICFYTLMISSLIIKNDKNEIALLKSRGAGRIQIFFLYLLESMVISGVSFAAGPYVGYFICRVLGSSNGFLEFVNRKSLPLVINADTYSYSLIAAVVFLIFMLVPALKASTKSIVQYKRSLLEDNEKPLWKRLYIDILVIGLSIYGLYSFNNRQNILNLTGVKGTDLGVDPLWFFISTFFILGASLVFLRIYPLLMRMIFRLGKRWWNPVLYFSLVNISRADKNQQSIMLFIILALSFGIINSNQARTINSNMVDRVMYNNGADVVIEPYNNLKHIARSTMNGTVLSSTDEYREPNYMEYCNIEGIKSMTKVFVDNGASLRNGMANVKDIRLMGIIPHEFGKTAWYRSDLMSHHINEYLNLLTGAQKAALLSTSLMDEYDLKKGDNIFITLSNNNIIECTIYEFIDYFPSCNPYSEERDGEKNHFAIINYAYILKRLPAQPYEIWIKKQNGTPDGAINAGLKERDLAVEKVEYSMQDIIEDKNDPMILGINGIFTMCFLITMFIAAMGFIVFWVLSIKDRALKFGIFRAMGMPMKSVTLIMICELFFVSGAAIITGILLGSVASKVFIPLLQMTYSSSQQVPPFIIIAYMSDYAKVIGVTFVMLVTAVAFLYCLVRRINIHQVLKLGED